MATRTATIQRGPSGHRNASLVTWTGLANGDDGSAYADVDFVDRTVQIQGTFGAGGSITIEGSNDGTTWFALTDPQGNAITKTAAGIEIVEEAPLYTRPRVTAGDGTTALTVVLLARRSR